MGHSFYYRSFKGLGSNRNWSQTWPCYSETVPEQHGEVTPRQSPWVWLQFLEHPGAKGESDKHSLATDSPGTERGKDPCDRSKNTHSLCCVPGVTWFCTWSRCPVCECMQPAVRKQTEDLLPFWAALRNQGTDLKPPTQRILYVLRALLNELPPINIQKNKSKSILLISCPPSRSVL